MNNWNVIQDTANDSDNEDDEVIQRYGSLNLDTTLPPRKPLRPPDELIHKRSPNLLQFLSISERIGFDPTITVPDSNGVGVLRSSMMGPRDIPNNTNDFYKVVENQGPQSLPYPMVDEIGSSAYDDDYDEYDADLPVLPIPMEVQKYNSHQRVLSSILDSTGVSIQEQMDYFDYDSHASTSLPITPLTPSKKLKEKLELPELKPMRQRQSMESMTDKPLPSLPPVKYDGEYTRPEEKSDLQLPNLPFSASLLGAKHFNKCANSSYLSNIWKWCLNLQTWFPLQHISLQELEKCFYLLFKFQIPELSEIFLEAIANDVMKTLIRNKNVVIQDEIVQFNDIPVSGVYPSLKDCYSPMNHIFPTPYRCYSHCCTYERLNYSISTHIQTSNMILGEDWVSHWKLSKDQLEDINKRVQIQQSHIFDLIKSVRSFINAGKILLEVFGEGFLKNKMYFGGENNLNWDKFYEDAFVTVKDLNEVTREYLFEPLIQKLNDDGKFVSGISEIFQNWLKEIQAPLLIYAEKRVPVFNLIKSESSLKNSKFTEWITRTNLSVSRDHTSERLFSVTFLIFFTTLKVTLLAVLKKTDESDPEFRSLSKVLKALDLLVQKSDKTQADAERKILINSLKKKLLLKYNKNPDIDLDLDNKEREIYKIGSLTRKRDILHRVLNDYPMMLILLDNFLLLAEETNDGNYKISEAPIHLSYLFVENKKYDEPSAPLVSVTPRRSTQADPISHIFRIRHFIKNLNFTFEAEDIEEKNEWLTVLMKLKMNMNTKASKFEPFKLSVIGDSLLGVDQSDIPQFRQVLSSNDNISLALLSFDMDLPRIESVSKILCFTRFKYMNKKFILLGTTNGLFISNIGQPRSWKKVIDLKNVSQVKVLEEFSLIFILSDKSFSYYFLDPFMNNEKLVGEKLSKRDVSFFKIGKQNNVTMIFFMKLKQSFSYFKVLIPILEKSTGKVESFQEYKKFYIPGECSDLTIFNSTIIIHTKKNFEVMTLSILYPQPIPDLNTNIIGSNVDGLDNLKKTLNQPGLKPLGIYKLINDLELLVVFNKFAMFVNKSGAISKDRLVRFSIKAHKLFFDKNLLILANEEFIEIWYINNTKDVNYQLVQVIAAQDLKMICDDQGKGIFSMIHPEFPERQLLLALNPKY